jgi:hypothetical protein
VRMKNPAEGDVMRGHSHDVDGGRELRPKADPVRSGTARWVLVISR